MGDLARVELAPDERRGLAVIARTDRDYVWIMARKPDVADADYRELVAFVESRGYDLSKLRRVPQRWPEPAGSGGAP